MTAGDDVGFTITVSNDGPGTALGATLNDPLPAGDGINWTIESRPGRLVRHRWGAAGGDVERGPIDLADDASFSVHIVSDTQPVGEVCTPATLTNTGTGTPPTTTR